MSVSILNKIRGLLKSNKYRAHIDSIKNQQNELDRRIKSLERRATVNGDEGWFIDYVKKDPSCALRVLRECDKSGG